VPWSARRTGLPIPRSPARISATLGDGTFNEQTVTSVATFESSDARIEGTWNETADVSVSQLTEGLGDVVTIWYHDIAIVNAAGSWVGHSEGFGRAADFDSGISAEGETIFLVGTGAYEGLTATLSSSEGDARGPSMVEGGRFEGVIFPARRLFVAE
jgi:hypothetical protein